ncbi:MAG: hypothetical protein N2V72_07205 [Methanophagales archaeon]|nr:hypothetical protein [Methanophagales archaeon]
MTLAKEGDLKRRDEVVNGKVRKKIILKNYFILARYRVKKIAIFGSEMAVDYLTRNIKESRIGNVEIVNKNRLVNYFGCVELASSPLSQDRQ